MQREGDQHQHDAGERRAREQRQKQQAGDEADAGRAPMGRHIDIEAEPIRIFHTSGPCPAPVEPGRERLEPAADEADPDPDHCQQHERRRPGRAGGQAQQNHQRAETGRETHQQVERKQSEGRQQGRFEGRRCGQRIGAAQGRRLPQPDRHGRERRSHAQQRAGAEMAESTIAPPPADFGEACRQHDREDQRQARQRQIQRQNKG
jgi:hypothetical protein